MRPVDRYLLFNSCIFPSINQQVSVLILTYLYLGHAAGRFKPLTSAVDIPSNSNSDAAGGFKPLTLDGVPHGGEKGIFRHSFCKMNMLCTSFAIH